jgi:type I restriction enzyme S subunit
LAGEWREYTFADMIQARVLEIGDGYRAKNSELGGDGPIFLRAGHVRDTHIDLDGVDRFRCELAGAVASKMSRPGDVLVTTKGNSTGRTSYVSDTLPPVVYSPHLSYWRSLDAEMIVPGFLRYWSRSQSFRDQLAGLAASTDMAPYLSLVDQKRLRIKLPAAGEQRRIAHILGTLDDKIELNRRMSETLEATARALFKSWFVDREGRDGAEGWPRITLASAFDINPPRSVRRDHPAPYLDMANMPTRGPSARDVSFRTPGSGARFRNGDTLLARITPCLENGKTALVDFLSDDECGWGSTEYIVLRPRPPLPEEFAYCLARLPEFVAYAVARMSGSSGRQRVSASAIGEYAISLPPAEHATRFREVVRPMFEGITLLTQEARTLVALRDALLPRLISGELRLKDADQLVEAVSA